MPGESTTANCSCTFTLPGTTLPIAPYVVSIAGLNGIITLGNTGSLVWRTEGNTIYGDFTASAGLGSVTSVGVSSPNSNLVITSGSPVTTSGTIVMNLAGNVGSISGLTMAADQMLYSTGPGVFVASTLTPFARTLLDDTTALLARITLGVVIGTNVQAWDTALDSYAVFSSWTGGDVDITSGTVTCGAISTNSLAVLTGIDMGGGDITNGGNGTFTGTLTALNLVGDISATSVTSGTLAATRGGTGNAVYVVGDLLTASGVGSLQRIADVAAGSYLMSGGVGVIPAWSTLKLPNAATTGDIFYGSAANTMGRIADVATGNVLLSGGVGVSPAYGKVTTAHTTGLAVSGTNNDITGFTSDIVFSGSIVDFSGSVGFAGQVLDGSAAPGNTNDILTSTSTGVVWSNQIVVSTIQVDGLVYLEGTITAAGSTGAKTINKQCGTVRFAAGAGTLIITNSLALAASTRAVATVCSVDTTLKSVAAVVTDGFITLTGNANATAETEVYFELRGIV